MADRRTGGRGRGNPEQGGRERAASGRENTGSTDANAAEVKRRAQEARDKAIEAERARNRRPRLK